MYQLYAKVCELPTFFLYVPHCLHMFPGLHSWLFFAKREQDNKANYLGYIDKLDLSGVSNTYIICTYIIVTVTSAELRWSHYYYWFLWIRLVCWQVGSLRWCLNGYCTNSECFNVSQRITKINIEFKVHCLSF